ncbi:DUF402 domain-containing protein [Streptomyces sp. FH025]|uniref:DUF402 domain-containing protein n=1 Tax=Streptomyces sp. FH025 TaxID=2815937 RepID=UPI001A9D472F|nr:DUF402 domain-containing protein [Streptomyces sp. FH025]MBO1414931.1 DUF402 domain-containing protein [Streptomyces sp. FH025]
MTVRPAPFAPGSIAVRRDIARGRVWTAMPYTVLADDGTTLTMAARPGIETLAPASWTTAQRTGDIADRVRGIEGLAAGRWELDRWTWRDTVVLGRFTAGEPYSVHRFLTPEGRPLRWYVNFELPYRRTAIGIDTFDLYLDLVVAPDLSAHTWKDEDEYAHARRLGVIDEATHRQVDLARDRALAQLRDRTGPFAPDPAAWTLPPPGPLPALPATALSTPAALWS